MMIKKLLPLMLMLSVLVSCNMDTEPFLYRGYMMGFLQDDGTFKGDDGRSYEIYFVPAGNALDPSVAVPVPSNYPYTISGNNYSGFVVTVTR